MSPKSVPDADIEYIQTTKHYHHVSVRPRAAFDEFRTPLAGEKSLSMDSPGYDVREGKTGPDEWMVESVLIPREYSAGGAEAEQLARDVVEDLDS